MIVLDHFFYDRGSPRPLRIIPYPLQIDAGVCRTDTYFVELLTVLCLKGSLVFDIYAVYPEDKRTLRRRFDETDDLRVDVQLTRNLHHCRR